MEESARPHCARREGPVEESCALILVSTANEEAMNQSDHITTAHFGREAQRIAFVQSGWHSDIVNQGRDAFLAEIARRGVPRACVDIYTVPGAFEIPLHAKLLAKTGRYTAIVACGFIVDGGIYRHEFVASAVINALMSVQLETEVPVFSCVLTPQHFHEHADHRDFFTQHFLIKGTEVATACIDTLTGLATVAELTRAA
jgi:6,7-dimethyl-8-ribityllumazine synthase